MLRFERGFERRRPRPVFALLPRGRADQTGDFIGFAHFHVFGWKFWRRFSPEKKKTEWAGDGRAGKRNQRDKNKDFSQPHAPTIAPFPNRQVSKSPSQQVVLRSEEHTSELQSHSFI